MEIPALLSKDAGQSAARLVDEMSRLYYLSRAIHVLAELGVADHLNDEPLSPEELAKKLEVNAATLSRLLRFLSAYGIFQEQEVDKYSHSDLSSVFRLDHPNSVQETLRKLLQHLSFGLLRR